MKQREVTGLLVIMTITAFALSCQIQAHTPPPRQDRHDSAQAALLGESRLGLSRYFYETADLYFHRGVAHQHEQAIQGTWFQKRLSEIKPHLHTHVTGAAAREILPWLDMAIRMNPHNVDFILLTAFWLYHEAGETARAQAVLKQAQVTNPFHYEIQLERGRLYLHQNNVAAARDCFDAARAFWPSPLTEANPDARFDLARILLYRSLIHEVDGERQAAAACLEQILTLFPNRTYLKDRIATLRQGNEPALLGPAVWNNLLQSEDEHTMLCDACEGEAHVHSDGHHSTHTHPERKR